MDAYFSSSVPVAVKEGSRRRGGFEVFSTPDDVDNLTPVSVSVSIKIGSPTVFLASQLAQRAFTILINGVDRSEFILASRNPFQIDYQVGSRGSATLRSISLSGTYRPQLDQEVLIYENETLTRLFGGLIVGTEEENYSGIAAHEVQIRCADWGTLLDRAIVSAYFEAGVIIWVPQTLVAEFLRVYVPQTGIQFAGGSGGSVIDTEILIPHWTATQAIKHVLDRDGLDFFVDPYKQLWIVDAATGYANAPFNLADNDRNFDKMVVKRDSTKYANWVGIRPDVREPPFWHETFAGDQDFGIGAYITRYQIATLPVVLVNQVIKTVIEFNAYSPIPHDFSYVPGGYGVFRNPANPAYTSSDTIEVFYPGKLQPLTIAEDAAEEALYGKVQVVIDVKDVWDRNLLQDLATGYLARLKYKPYIVSVTTQRKGLFPGQKININTTKPLVPNLDMIISSISGTCVGRKTLDIGADSGKQARMTWTFDATNAQIQGQASFERAILDARQARVQGQDRSRLTIVADLAVDVPGLTNPGLTAMVIPTSREVDQFGFLKEIRLRFDTPPVTDTIQIDVYRNGVSVFNSGYIEYRPQDVGSTVLKYLFATVPYPVQDGDIFTVEVITADATAKNGKLEIEIQY